MATAIDYKNDRINMRMVSDATAVFDVTVTMVDIVGVGRSIVPSPLFFVSSFFSF